MSVTTHSTSSLVAVRKSAGLSQAELAKQAGVSRHAVMRLEQLCYPTPLPNIIDTLSDITGLSVRELNNEYAQDVAGNRYWSGQEWYLNPIGLKLAQQIVKHANTTDVHSHGFVTWRKALAEYVHQPTSAIHFCMAFSIHSATLSHYEAGRTKFPKAIGDALTAAGAYGTLINLFETSSVFNTIGD